MFLPHTHTLINSKSSMRFSLLPSTPQYSVLIVFLANGFLFYFDDNSSNHGRRQSDLNAFALNMATFNQK